MKAKKTRQKSTLGTSIIAGLKEAIAFERGMLPETKVTRRLLSSGSAEIGPAPVYSARRVANLRDKLNLSQPVFAAALNVSSETVKKWEQGTREPDGAALRLLELVEKHPEWIVGAVRENPPKTRLYRARGRATRNNGPE